MDVGIIVAIMIATTTRRVLQLLVPRKMCGNTKRFVLKKYLKAGTIVGDVPDLACILQRQNK
jgi:hypothetical protein